MKRRSRRFGRPGIRKGVLIALFAVLLQLAAPIQAFQAAVALASDPLANAPICSIGGDHGDTPASPMPNAMHDCWICQVACGTHAVLTPAAVALPAPHTEVVASVQLDRTNLARAPPALRPFARAPPFLS